jgi:hypothetical protein
MNADFSPRLQLFRMNAQTVGAARGDTRLTTAHSGRMGNEVAARTGPSEKLLACPKQNPMESTDMCVTP